MQIEQVYTGTVESTALTVVRPYSYGIASTTTLYSTQTDTMNQTVANFLKDTCGVDAAYEDRGDTGYKWLWIFDVPFFFTHPTGSSPKSNLLYGPYSTTPVGEDAPFETFNANGTYTIRLRLFGDPSTAFALALFSRNSTTSGPGTYKFVKATNILTQGNAVFWALGNTITTVGSNPYSSKEVAYGNAIDLDSSGALVVKSLVTQVPYRPYQYTSAGQYELNFDKIPLIPIRFVLWELKGCYCLPLQWGLPNPVYWYNPTQTEIEIAGRKFIITVNPYDTYYSNISSSYINLGLLEVTDQSAG